ncbi:MAG: NADH:ubiquinone reductase (Na(+)-transporting) subunit E [Planctomycetota bacterium]
MEYLQLLVKSALIENMALAFFLGMCSYVAISKKVDTAFGLGVAVVFVQVVTVPVNNLMFQYFMKDGAMGWIHPSLASVDMSFLGFLVYIGSIAAVVQVLEMFMERYVPALHATLGIFLPLITVNCVIMAGALFMVERDYNFPQSVVYGFGSGAGWAIAIVLLAGIRERMRYSNVPPGLRGLGMSFIITALMAMGFMIFAGL